MTLEAYWRDFADWAAGPIDAPETICDRAEDAVIDTVACILSGQTTPTGKAAAKVAGSTRADTAMRLAAAGHALDFDDYDAPSIGHPSTVLVPALLAYPETTGKEAIDAFLVGLEAMDRLGEVMNPTHYETGWQATATLGGFGAAAVAGRALRLNADRMFTALAIAAGAASGIKAQFGSGAKPMNVGFAAQTGVQSAELAAAGLDARGEAIWGPQGFIALTGGPGAAEKIPSGPPGRPFLIETYGLIAKHWPCCGYLARIVDTMVDLAAEGVHPNAIDTIDLRAPPRNAAVLVYDRPETPDQARFSPAYCAAVSLISGGLSPQDFAPTAIARDDVMALARKISFASTGKPQSDVDLSPDDPDEITIRLMSGAKIERRAAYMRGGPEAPMTRDDFIEKLRLCAPPEIDLTALITALTNLSNAPDLTGITRHIPQPRP